ncbi:MAG: aminoglycoside phosphotransferase family protein [Mycobacteriales bacterium]
MRDVIITDRLRRARANSAEGMAWLDRLPDLIARTCARWELAVSGPPYTGGVCGWVAQVRRADGSPAVLKVTWPHPEAAGEAAALRWWDGAGAVRLVAEDAADWVMLLEPCLPGTPLREAGLPDERGLDLAAELLNGLWAKGIPEGEGDVFGSMQSACREWADVAAARVEELGDRLVELGIDRGILGLGIELLRSLPGSAERRVVVHGDFNPGNLLAAQRSPFLAIDPKPMLGDPAFDPWQLVAQLGWPFRRTDAPTVVPRRIRRLADQLGLSAERIAAWGVARDVEGGLWAASDGRAEDGAKWIRSAMQVAPMLG